MASFRDLRSGPGQRNEARDHAQVFLELHALDWPEDMPVDALTADVSRSGLGLLAKAPLPVGTVVAIEMCGQNVAIGEVANIDETNYGDMARLGVRILKKNKLWPL